MQTKNKKIYYNLKKNKYNSLEYFNILRFIGAICITIFLHYNDHLLQLLRLPLPFSNNHLLEYISKNSYVFVEMFFIISGVLFAKAYFKKIISGMNFKDFMKKRIIRIFPLVIITTLIMYLGNFILFNYSGEYWKSGTLSIWQLFMDIVFGGKTLFNIPDTLNGPIWYINVLMVCYVIAFSLSRLYKKYNTKLLFCIPILIGIMIMCSKESHVFWNYNVARGLISFFTGVCLEEYFNRFKKKDIDKKIIIKIIILLELILFLIIFLNDKRGIYTSDKSCCYNFLFFPELMILLYDCKPINKICQTKLIKFLGNISYGIYLWDFPILISFYILNRMHLLTIPVTSKKFIIINFIVHIIIGAISYIFVDKIIVNKLKKKYLKG